VALRIIHDLNVYHRMDAEIILESEALSSLSAGSWSDGNIVYVGKPAKLVHRILGNKQTLFGVTATSGLSLRGQPLDNGCCM
jgi:hypothetical protein